MRLCLDLSIRLAREFSAAFAVCYGSVTQRLRVPCHGRSARACARSSLWAISKARAPLRMVFALRTLT